jgi:sporulation protein YlmC with PRC-barrel domain
MSSDVPALRSADLIGQSAYDTSGGYLGRIADVTVVADVDGVWRLREVIVTPGFWGRLLGYDEPEETGPWPLLVFARWVIRRRLRRVPWAEVRVGDPARPA